ncbi:hypothetical protein FF38_03933 [Lucilia cuprina]|uniref:Uncharacterized protein n=1 Tax=Lucilia cuprina TaxID=7375 RepID=A0A0L0CFQ8_LUCCU|nr:hypothetical protein CVS40_9760 [Lucilia cuprina]KNC30324.1 hypothetical protein FF38_03933 [Lucilia cuprina]
MSSDSNQENNQRNNEAGDKEQTVSDKKPLSFKDWKSLKESQNKPQEKTQNAKSKNVNKTNNNNISKDNRNSDRNVFNNSARNFNGQGVGNFFNTNQRLPGIMPPNNFFGMNNFNNNRMNNNNFNDNFGISGNNNNCFGISNNGFNNNNGFGFNNYNGPNLKNNNNSNFNSPNTLGGNNKLLNSPNRLNGPNVDLPDNFFASDGIYRQRDMMQKPLPPSHNPFKNEQKANELLKEFDRSRYTKDDKKKKKSKKSAGDNKKSDKTKNNGQGSNVVVNNEPKVYIANPKAKQDGKPFIPKPKIPEENLEISKEEKKQQWKEYREAMKPFKNREFYNAKRVVQRLGKIPVAELEERQLLRLANAREIMANHKKHLTEKYGNYVKADDSSNEMGELYVLKKNPSRDMYFKPPVQNTGNFGDHEAGRKILGGYGGFKGFVSGGMLERPTTTFSMD